MTIRTVFANVSCRDIESSTAWYQRLFGGPPTRRPMPTLSEWQFTESAEVQVHEQRAHAGHSTLTLGVLPLEPVRERLLRAGLEPDRIEETGG